MANEELPNSRTQSDAPSEDEYQRLADRAQALRKHDRSAGERESRSSMNAAANAWLKYTTVGLQFVLVLLLPLGLGYWGDTSFGTLPWLTLGGFVLGAIAAMASIIREVLRMDERDAKRPLQGEAKDKDS